MARSGKHDWFTPVLLMLFGMTSAIGILSGRWSGGVSSPIWRDGSQWHLDVRYGALRFLRGDYETTISGQPPGAQWEDMLHWNWQLMPHIAPFGPVGITQIPLWFPALLFLAWAIMRAARRSLRAADGVCLGCGRAVGGGVNRCPKCGRVLRE